jgi:hypothetical protein
MNGRNCGSSQKTGSGGDTRPEERKKARPGLEFGVCLPIISSRVGRVLTAPRITIHPQKVIKERNP